MSPKMGAPLSYAFASQLRLGYDKTNESQINQIPKAELFSFYSKDINNWSSKIADKKKRELSPLIESSPSKNTVFKIFDAEAKGNTGLVKPLSI